MTDADTIAALRRVPGEVEAAMRDLPDDRVRACPSPDEWSLLEIACHLRDAAEEEGLRLRRMLEEDNPALPGYDEQARAAERRYAEDDPRRVLITLRAFWTGYAYQLERIDAADWERPAVHPERGPVTVRTRAERAAAHAGEHIAQMRGVLANWGLTL
jgi:hypothetical protein